MKSEQNLTPVTPPQKQRWRTQQKWGGAVTGGTTGFFNVPDALMRGQHRLGINSTEMVVLMNLLMHWWNADELPHPRPSSIARRMGVTTRTVERTIDSLVEKQLVYRLDAEDQGDRPSIRRFDLTGLVQKVNEIAEEFRAIAV